MEERYINRPPPSYLIESLRDIGYSMESAIADIIDNSLTAKADNIQINFSWNSGAPWLAVIDDGQGMSSEELRNAMRFGSMNPLKPRSIEDLGRFGLGMKTASFSQCRHLTVLSKRENQLAGCEWDLDKIINEEDGDWKLGILNDGRIKNRVKLATQFHSHLAELDCGTLVFWENFDRFDLHDSTSQKEANFNSLIYDARKHLELVFHRFLSPLPGRKKINISINGDGLNAFNPFNPKNTATQELEEQQITLEGETITVQPYILPHHDKISRQEYDDYSGKSGYLHSQGFYIYRNNRLIIKGTWFRLIKKEELNKLIRIKIDIPNSLDHLWKIDVKKSFASPPERIRRELSQIIGRIEVAGRKVYKQRGKKLSSSIRTPVWIRKAKGGGIIYEINRNHPFITKLLENIPKNNRFLFHNLLKMFEGNFPVDLFYSDIARKPEEIVQPKFTEKELKDLLKLFVSFLPKSELNDKDFVEKTLLSTDPFASCKETIEKILREEGYICE